MFPAKEYDWKRYGGAPLGPQCNALREGIDVLVGTPGRIKDLSERGVLHLGEILFATLDEADQMLDMGFIPDVRRIMGHVGEERQTLLFSATMPKEIRRLADETSEPWRGGSPGTVDPDCRRVVVGRSLFLGFHRGQRRVRHATRGVGILCKK